MVGRPFPKGKSGNPSGRPRLPEELRACLTLAMSKAQEAAPAAVDRLVQLLKSDDERVALKAAEVLLMRAMGAPVVVVEKKTDEPVQMVQLADGVFEAK